MVTMSITLCPHCDEHYDTDTHVEHEEMCKEDMEDNEKALADKAEEEYVKKVWDEKFDNPLEQVDELVKQAKELKIK